MSPAAGDDGVARLVERFRSARRDPAWAVLEGLHAVKHALRFGAALEVAASPDRRALTRLAEALAPDVAPLLEGCVEEVPEEVFRRLAPLAPPTGLVAIAPRPAVSAADILADPTARPVVLLERPAHLGNLGAAVRVAAAAGAAGLLVGGGPDPWRPEALRGAAGLHFALPVARLEELERGDRVLAAIDPGGEPLGSQALPGRALLAFGSERQGLSAGLLAAADLRLAIPMQPGVSSLNLATAVAVVLYSWRLAG